MLWSCAPRIEESDAGHFVAADVPPTPARSGSGRCRRPASPDTPRLGQGRRAGSHAAALAQKGYEPRYDIALQVLETLPYNRWREMNPEDSLRFHALRLREVGMIRSHPNRLIAQGTDWRFLNELKRELKP